MDSLKDIIFESKLIKNLIIQKILNNEISEAKILLQIYKKSLTDFHIETIEKLLTEQ